jgi:serine/threonine-protein phosphatase 2A regulatory subunit A
VAKTLKIVGPKLNTAVLVSQVKPCIGKLNEDTDFDVRYFASEAALGELSIQFLLTFITFLFYF